MAKVLTKRASSGKGLVAGVGIYEPSVLCMTDAPHLPRIHGIWRGMLLRTTEQYAIRKSPSYAGTSVAPDFHRFADFAEWVTRQVGWDGEGFQLDKDLLVTGNRIYAPDTCVFLPRWLNAHLTNNYRVRRRGLPLGVNLEESGRFTARLRTEKKNMHLGIFDTPEDAFAAYKAAKEENYKRLAIKYQDQIDPRAFDALMVLTMPEQPTVQEQQ